MNKERTKELNDVDLLEENVSISKIILYNDDVNTFDWVIECLCEICKHELYQAEQCALLVHFKGKAIVKTGDFETLKPICEALCDKSLSAVIEQ
jgi:ATP-dependent Clp protease adaptor protein ClpS